MATRQKDPLKRLKRELQEYDFEATSGRPQGDKIRETLDEILDNNDGGELDDRQPPLELLAYTVNAILYPSFLPELIPDLIRLTTMIEFYRLELTEKASLLIDLNTFVELNKSSQVSSLTKRQRQYFQHLVDNREVLRQIFLNNISALCVLDLKRSWLANRDTDFWLLWTEYFSIFQEDYDSEGLVFESLSHPFHHKILPEEIAFLQDCASHLPEFMDATVRVAVEQADPGRVHIKIVPSSAVNSSYFLRQSIREMFQLQLFSEQFITDTLPPEVLDSLEYHLNFVLGAADQIKAVTKMG
ncbi:hypothetical protein HYPSUDRAFT_78191 [Hypholoma sublateritium FD-334 SS-4]|uniref:Uncharacterized protein n=1 Tax=Hypholoma sublateritium (strain FD-334 SS-4) TaxID=945553 RepID=A0A0D2NPR9_HYPSF|nr:hypothetical protein HYPSUDRAFT_78191 [Hypholoma sublateritium FD-334 SS-4]